MTNPYSPQHITELLNMGKELPSIEEIEQRWDIPDEPEEPEQPNVDDYLLGDDAPGKDKYDEDMNVYGQDMEVYNAAYAAYERKVWVLTWFLDKYLPLAVGPEYWGTNQRLNNLLTDKIILPGDKSKKKKCLVTSSSEAFSVMLYKNCRIKWINVCEWKRIHPNDDPPAYDVKDDETHKYHAIWSNSRTGSRDFSGWSIEALEYYEAKKAEVKQWRADDLANDKYMIKLAQELVKAENQNNKGKKRAAPVDVEETAPARKIVKICFDEE